MEEFLSKTKKCLSIIDSSKVKDDEIMMWINAGINDLNRQGIIASIDTENSLVQSAIIMFVKSNFGFIELKEKEQAQKTYSLLCHNLGLSSAYKESDSDA